jgi:hypothetical protein
MSSTVAFALRSDASTIQPRHHRVLPHTVQAGRHQVVHHVVALGDLVEHIVDQRLLLAFADLPEAVGGFHAALRGGACIRHQFTCFVLKIAATIADRPSGRYLPARDEEPRRTTKLESP